MKQIPLIPVQVFENGNGAVGLNFRLANEFDAFVFVGFVVALKIVRVEKQKHTTTGLITDAGSLFIVRCPRQQDLGFPGTRRGDQNPSLLLGGDRCILDKVKTQRAHIEINRFIVVVDDDGNVSNGLVHSRQVPIFLDVDCGRFFTPSIWIIDARSRCLKRDAEARHISEGTPKSEVAIDETLVQGLLEDQHPDLATLPIRHVDDGWDNAMYRVGDELAVRIPRRIFGAPLIDSEQKWLPILGKRLPIPIPVPRRIGEPGRGYPWRWSVVPWLPGVPANVEEPYPDQAARLGEFLRRLHVAAPLDAPTSEMRGIPLKDREKIDMGRMEGVADKTDLITEEIRAIWNSALEAPIDVEPCWLHGDLHPKNILVENGVISGIIDWGDMNSGDRATDVASIWMLFEDSKARQSALEAYGEISDATLVRAKGWAVLFGVLLLDAGLVDNPEHAEIGRRALVRVAQDA